jgi:hypothetical protein
MSDSPIDAFMAVATSEAREPDEVRQASPALLEKPDEDSLVRRIVKYQLKNPEATPEDIASDLGVPYDEVVTEVSSPAYDRDLAAFSKASAAGKRIKAVNAVYDTAMDGNPYALKTVTDITASKSDSELEEYLERLRAMPSEHIARHMLQVAGKMVAAASRRLNIPIEIQVGERR